MALVKVEVAGLAAASREMANTVVDPLFDSACAWLQSLHALSEMASTTRGRGCRPAERFLETYRAQPMATNDAAVGVLIEWSPNATEGATVDLPLLHAIGRGAAP